MRLEVDWRYLRISLIMLAASVAVSAVLIGYSWHHRMQASDALAGQSSARDALSVQLAATIEDQVLIGEYFEPYLRLASRGVIGQEQRLDWVDSLHGNVKVMKMPNVRYQIDPQSPLYDEGSMEIQDFTVVASHLKMEMGILHEGDLLRIFNRMHSQVPGIFQVQGCVLSRAEPEFGYYSERPNLNAGCNITWITLRPVEKAEDGS